MPNFDKTGPAGAGPRTGRGMGGCMPGYGYGCGCGYGRGMGMGRFVSPKNQLMVLKQQEAVLTEELEMLREDIAELEKSA